MSLRGIWKKNIFIVNWMDQTIRKNKTFRAELPFGSVLQLGMLSFVLTSDSRPEAAETQWQELEHSVSGVVKRGYNPLKIHSKGSLFCIQLH